MRSVDHVLKPSVDAQLERIVEPLASYISAASRPRAALLSAVAVLNRVVQETNGAATTHVDTFSDGRWCQSPRQALQLKRGI